MLKILSSNQFKKDIKQAYKRGFEISKLTKVVNLLALKERLDDKYRDHQLYGRYSGFREYHVEPDWILIYRIDDDRLELLLFRTGTHSDLF